MKKILLAAALAWSVVSACTVAAADEADRDKLSLQDLTMLTSRFSRLMDMANCHDLEGLHTIFWQSPSALLVAKTASPSEGNWAGFWGNDAVDRKLHDIAVSGPVMLVPDLSKLQIVGLTQDVAESYAPVNITVSYAGQDGTAKPFLMIVNWIRIANEWKIAAEILVPVPPVPAAKG